MTPMRDQKMSSERGEIRIVIADDHAMFREALRSLTQRESGIRVIGEASNGREAIEVTLALKPDILLLDVAMPRLSGMEVLRRLADLSPGVRVILLIDAPDRDQIVEAAKLGARGIVSKDTSTRLLFKGIRAVASGEYWLGHQNISDVIESLRSADPNAGPETTDRIRLTRRQTEIIAAIVDGHTNREIARRLSISEQTVKHHLTGIFEKVGVTNRLELAIRALHLRLTSISDAGG